MKYRRYNRSYTYILPLLGNSYMQFTKADPDNLGESILIDTYLRSEFMPEKKEHLFVRYKQVDRYKPIYIWLQNHKYYDGSYEYEGDIVYCFKIPFNRMSDYNNFLASNYSMLKDEYKRHILKFQGLRVTSDVAKILYKDESLYQEMEEYLNCDFIPRTQELGQKIDLRVETHRKKSKLKLTKYKPIWE